MGVPSCGHNTSYSNSRTSKRPGGRPERPLTEAHLSPLATRLGEGK
jgi:hypothetical protein